jgi:hypothetical protein
MVSGQGTAARVEQLADRARLQVGLDDLGSDSWREGLTILVESMESTPGADAAARDDLYDKFVDALANRLRVVDYATRHPEVAIQAVERPLIILGLPRTGTTVASCLLDEDPARRSLLNWEAGDSIPPATTTTLRTDPRCLNKKAQLDELAALLEARRIPIPHWEDADGPTECTFVLNQDFKALLWETYMPSAAYCDWLLAADLTSAYQYERLVLQVLQSSAPGVWSLKMPSHALHVDELLATFPDARLVWAHRDPFRATASALSMYQLGRSKLWGDTLDQHAVVEWTLRQLHAHIDRLLRARDQIGDAAFFHLHYADLLRDPLECMRSLYDWAGDELSPGVERAMEDWLVSHPQDRFGVRPYALDQFGISREDLEPLFREYLDTFPVELETT